MNKTIPVTELFPHLVGWRFPASAVTAAAGMNQTALTNFLSKTDLVLCSESAGQGRGRQYCLIDVYQLALLNQLASLTGRVAWSATALNGFLFPDDVYGEVFALAARVLQAREPFKTLRKQYCEDAGKLPAAYVDRDWRKPWFFCVSVPDLVVSPPAFITVRNEEHGVEPGDEYSDRWLNNLVLRGGVFVNVTRELMIVDALLAEFLGLRPTLGPELDPDIAAGWKASIDRVFGKNA